ncbi:hypothetical protein NDS46_09905 [Paenibacillus thiaminolyticus]|uniref:hypothetical protein n=1 Tax=Paenibacillus thiaminolyticus TaxID=49283 RepID=UPI0023307C24|nr:hypothetical protein [Paenibacillus thiaminolyticus]WCF10134.1 hypothetical protein NDS46_09905 [Paenibacillus thiaminolyticus]
METQPHASFILSKDSPPIILQRERTLERLPAKPAQAPAAAGQMLAQAPAERAGCSLRGRRQRARALTPGRAAARREA